MRDCRGVCAGNGVKFANKQNLTFFRLSQTRRVVSPVYWQKACWGTLQYTSDWNQSINVDDKRCQRVQLNAAAVRRVVQSTKWKPVVDETRQRAGYRAAATLASVVIIQGHTSFSSKIHNKEQQQAIIRRIVDCRLPLRGTHQCQLQQINNCLSQTTAVIL